MKDFYTANGRAKVMIFKADASNQLPSCGELKKDFLAKNVTFYKSRGYYSDVIWALFQFPAYANGVSPSFQEQLEVNRTVYASFDESATINSFAVLKHSDKVLRYADISSKDYERGRQLKLLIDELSYGSLALDNFCNGIKIFQKELEDHSVEGDRSGFDTVEFLQRYCATIDDALVIVRRRLREHCDKFHWGAELTAALGEVPESANASEFKAAA